MWIWYHGHDGGESPLTCLIEELLGYIYDLLDLPGRRLAEVAQTVSVDKDTSRRDHSHTSQLVGLSACHRAVRLFQDLLDHIVVAPSAQATRRLTFSRLDKLNFVKLCPKSSTFRAHTWTWSVTV